jgi:hypothetical protein
LRVVADWATISSLATAGGTLVLAGATFSAVRSSNRSARIAEQALQERRRPLLVTARLDDPLQKVMFADGHWIRVAGSQAAVDPDGDAIYLGIGLRNIGTGIAVLQAWHVWPEIVMADVEHRPPEEFRDQVRDIYIAPGDIGVWQGALRGGRDDALENVEAARAERRAFTVDLLYSDQLGGQRTISRFTITPVGEDGWLGNVGLHWNLDYPGRR